MISITIKVTKIEELVELVPIFKKFNIELDIDNKYNPSKHTILREQARQSRIIELLKENKKMTSLEIFKKIKKKDRCMYKSIIRDVWALYKNGIIDYTKHSESLKHGNNYEVHLR